MSLIQEFLQQNSGVHISPSLPIQTNNLRTAFTFMVDQLQQTRASFNKTDFINTQLNRAKELLDVLNKFNNEIDRQSIEFDISILSDLILDRQDQKWKQYLIKSKEQSIKKLIIGNIQQSIKESNSIFDKSLFQRYIDKLEQVKSAQEKNKMRPQIIIEADKIRIQFMKRLNIGLMKTLSQNKINVSLVKVKDSLNRISKNFQYQLESCSRIEKTNTTNSPLKSSLKQQKFQSPIRQVDSHRLISSKIQNQQIYENSYLITLGKPRGKYLPPYI